MEPDGSLPHSQVPATCTYPAPDQSSPCPPIPLLETHFNIITHLQLGLPSCFLPSGFPTKTLYQPLLSPTHATFPTHLILLDLKKFTEWNSTHFLKISVTQVQGKLLSDVLPPLKTMEALKFKLLH
jgi:hypothetical protein